MLTYIGAKNLVLDLVLALQNLPAARLLPSPNGRGSLRSDLLRLAPLVLAILIWGGVHHGGATDATFSSIWLVEPRIWSAWSSILWSGESRPLHIS